MPPFIEEERRTKLLKRTQSASAPKSHSNNPQPVTSGLVQRAASNSQQLSSADVLTLQRTLGNQSVQRLLSRTSGSAPPSLQRDHEEEEESGASSKKGAEKEKENEKEGEFHLSDEDLEAGGEKGFELINESPSEEGEEPKSESRSYSRNRQEPQPKQKKTLRERYQRFGRIAKQTLKNFTVNSYGKLSIHSIMNADEKMLNRAERLMKSDPAKARQMLNHVHMVVKQGLSDISSVNKGLRIALLAPIWFTRWQIAHARWKALNNKLDLIQGIAPRRGAKKQEEPIVEGESEQEPQHEWRGARAQIKDTFGEMHNFMLGVGMNTHKGKGMTDRQKLLSWQKWRTNEMDDSSIKLGKQRSDAWQPAYVRQGQKRDSQPGVTLGKQRPEWMDGRYDKYKQRNKMIGTHRWHMEKPSGKRSSDIQMGTHRPVWGFNKPSSDQSGYKMGRHRGWWGFDKPGTEPSTSHRLGTSRPDWGFEKPSGEQGNLFSGTHRLPPLPPTPWQGGHARFLHLSETPGDMSGHRSAPQSEDVGKNEETSTIKQSTTQPDTMEQSSNESGTGLKVDEIYTLKSPLQITGRLSNTIQQIDAGIKVMIVSIDKQEMVRIDSENSQSGIAPLSAVKAALGIT